MKFRYVDFEFYRQQVTDVSDPIFFSRFLDSSAEKILVGSVSSV